MKAQIVILGTFIAAGACSSLELGQTKAPRPDPVSRADNPLIPVSISSEAPTKKKVVNNRFPGLLAVLSGLKTNFLGSFFSALRPISTQLFGGIDSDYENSSYKRTETDYYHPEYTYSRINTLPDDPSFSSYDLDAPEPIDEDKMLIKEMYKRPHRTKEYNIDPRNMIDEPQRRKIYEEETDTWSEDKEQGRSPGLMGGLKKQFARLHAHIPKKTEFVKKGIKNAKKNLLSNVRLAKLYASQAGKNAADMFENTVRSSNLLGDLVKKGLITPASAAKELASKVGRVGISSLKAGAKGIQSASDYLMSTSTETVGGIMRGLKRTPSAISGLLNLYPGLFTDTKFKLSHLHPFTKLKYDLDTSRIYNIIHPPHLPQMGSIWDTGKRTINKIKGQWGNLAGTIDTRSIKYKDRFLELTEDLSRTLDALQTRLGTDVSLRVPGIEQFKNQFNAILSELKKKNSLTISGNFSLKDLLDYSMGAFSKLKSLDKAIISLMPQFSQVDASAYLSSHKNPIGSVFKGGMAGFNNLSLAAIDEIHRFSGGILPGLARI
ncbi:hypothetical protein NEOKW01_1402 [Nematocida sp. AWRm80]|nr:hypothetical protein NEOKW01_1402 [Nematocida sp. AWRm80]